MESPEAASEMACPMVLQAVVGDLQLLLSLPVVPLTYQVVLAKAAGVITTNKATSISFKLLSLKTCLRFVVRLRDLSLARSRRLAFVYSYTRKSGRKLIMTCSFIWSRASRHTLPKVAHSLSCYLGRLASNFQKPINRER